MRLRFAQGLAVIAAIVSAYLLAFRPDIERYLHEHIHDNPMLDAFSGLNRIFPVFMTIVAGNTLLIARLVKRHQYSLFLPLLFGPAACLLGWYLTENFNDPNWFHLFAIESIGMLVSSCVTALLSIVDTKVRT